ncbi:MAG TPA: LuxR C-terminal-related transcriptional regulator [Sedimentisphaerales bacterium]|nr:LuxR C-terminal-related transcriptional regulator [Sedimentisphaerales bacterium]
MKSGSRKRIYCYGKEPRFRQMVERAVGGEDKRVGCFSQGRECLENLSVKPCDVLIVDLDESEQEGLELLEQVHRTAPWIATVAIVEQAAVSVAVKAIKAGACNCLEKPVEAHDLCQAIEEQLARVALLPRAHRALTHMEIQILQLILAGKTSQSIAIHLHRSKRTVDVHRKNIMRKLQASNLVDLIRRAMSIGLIDEGAPHGHCELNGTTHPTDDSTPLCS